MSNLTFEEQLREAMVDLREQLEADMGYADGKSVFDSEFLLQNFAPLYIRYLIVFKKLEDCYDQVLHPQKRADVRVVLDATIGRMLELKHQLLKHCGDYINYDDVLVDLKLVPEVLEIPIPRYFTEERKRELEDRQKLFNTWGQTDPSPAENKPAEDLSKEDWAPPMDITQAITLLQCNERGRQGRLRAKFMKEIRQQEERERKVLAEGQVECDLHQSATKIQKHFKGFLARKKCKELRLQELEFLGIEFPSGDRLAKETDKLDKVLHRRKLAQQQNQQQLEADRMSTRQEIKDQEGGKLMEDLHDELLEKIIKLKTSADEAYKDKWMEFPSVEDGGSGNPEWMTFGTEPTPEQAAAASAEAAAAGKGKKDSKGKKDAKKGDGKKGKKGEDDADANIEVIPVSKFWSRLHEGTDRYVTVWQDRFKPTDFLQKYDRDLLRAEIMEGPGGLEAELRGHVDALIRVEIHNLQIGLMQGGGKKQKKGKGGGKKGKDKSKKGGAKGDAAGDKVKAQDVYNLCRELYWIKFLPQVPPAKVSDYIGAHNLMAKAEEDAARLGGAGGGQTDEISKKWQELLDRWEADPDQAKVIEKNICMKKEEFQALFEEWKKGNPSTNAGVLFEPSMAQVRQAVTEYCILPLGSQTIRDLVDVPGDDKKADTGKGKKGGGGASQAMTALFYGASLSGKTMMSHAIANETGSLFFDLTPTGPAFADGKYSAPNPIRILLAMVFKVARAWAPAVIYIDNVDCVFTKRKGKNKNPELDKIVKPLKKELLANVKTLEPTDRVLVVGNCKISEDVLKAQDEIMGFFKTCLYFPHPDYASRMLLWTSLVAKAAGAKHGQLLLDTDYEVLAYMTAKCTSGVIANVVSETLTKRRVRRLAHRLLKAEEFLNSLVKYKPVFREEWLMMREFSLKVPFGHPGRRKTAEDLKASDAEDGKGKKKGKKKGKR
ncbi:putative 26S protease subunit YTA6 [Diplonema papillatum]|nr:putative 26S protease subunit YTA6 [Diplonema papillatum]